MATRVWRGGVPVSRLHSSQYSFYADHLCEEFRMTSSQLTSEGAATNRLATALATFAAAAALLPAAARWGGLR